MGGEFYFGMGKSVSHEICALFCRGRRSEAAREGIKPERDRTAERTRRPVIMDESHILRRYAFICGTVKTVPYGGVRLLFVRWYTLVTGCRGASPYGIRAIFICAGVGVCYGRAMRAPTEWVRNWQSILH